MVLTELGLKALVPEKKLYTPVAVSTAVHPGAGMLLLSGLSVPKLQKGKPFWKLGRSSAPGELAAPGSHRTLLLGETTPYANPALLPPAELELVLAHVRSEVGEEIQLCGDGHAEAWTPRRMEVVNGSLQDVHNEVMIVGFRKKMFQVLETDSALLAQCLCQAS